MDSMKNYSTVKTHFETILIKHATSHCEITLNLEKVQITETYEDQYYIGFVGTSTSNEGFCRKCGQVLTRFKQYKTTYTTIARFNDKNVVLKLRKKMYHCPDCRSSTTERLIKQSGSNQKTDSFLASMIGCLKETVSYSAVARLYKVSVSNLIRHFDKTHLAETRVDRKAVRNISVDEVRFVKQRHSNYQFVIMDSDTKQVLDILKSRQSSDIQHYLRAHYQGILTFTQDLWRPYRTVALNLFQGVKVVADKFHVVRQFMWAFSRARISLAKAKNKRTCRFWKILTKTRQKLDDRGKIRLEQLLAEDPELRVLHEAKEMALSLFRCKDSESYLRLLPAFKAAIEQDGLEEFRKAYKSLVNWHEEIINMFELPYSNGSMERTNRTIKQSKNIAFGFTNLARATKLIQYRVN